MSVIYEIFFDEPVKWVTLSYVVIRKNNQIFVWLYVLVTVQTQGLILTGLKRHIIFLNNHTLRKRENYIMFTVKLFYIGVLYSNKRAVN